MASATSAMTGARPSSASEATLLSNTHLSTTSQSVIGLSTTSISGTVPAKE